MSGCLYLQKRGGRYYFRARLPIDLAFVLSRTHVVVALRTADVRVAKLQSARFFLLLAYLCGKIRSKMESGFNTNGSGSRQIVDLAASAFALGAEFAASTHALRLEFDQRLNQLINDLHQGGYIAGIDQHHTLPVLGDVATSISKPSSGWSDHKSPMIASEKLASVPWTTLKRAFFDDKPGLTRKTIWSYNQAFSDWELLIGDKEISEIRRPDVKIFADHLRSKDNARGGQLNYKTIQRSVGHIKTFLHWAVSAGHAIDDKFEAVTGREMSRQEYLRCDARREFTPAEFEHLFSSSLIKLPRDNTEQAEKWFLTIAALCGARTEEISLAPAKLVMLGDIHCLDLRDVGRKTLAAPRLVPILPALLEMGLLQWAEMQAKRGYTLTQPCAKQRTPAAWSKKLNRYINKHISPDPQLVLYSLRHSFRQMLRAANIGDELSNKIFGHSTGKIGAGYGRNLSHDEALLFTKNVKLPINLDHLFLYGQAYNPK